MLFNSLVSPLQYAANAPKQWLDWLGEHTQSLAQLRAENHRLIEQNLLMSKQAQRSLILERENQRLRALLEAPAKADTRTMLAEVLSLDSNVYAHQIVINRGALDGVYEGQAVLDENGIVGQILSVGTTTSRVLLITDNTHAIPVRLVRNDLLAVASGSGRLSELSLQHVSQSADIQPGDSLVSSGLGGVFPDGYPVATVTSVRFDDSRPFAKITAEPVAALDRLRLLRLEWSKSSLTDVAVAQEEGEQ